MPDKISVIEGRTPTRITWSGDEIIFRFNDGTSCKFYHEQGCCEDVHIEDVNGDWNDLIDTPLVVAEVRTSEGWNDDSKAFGDEHETWTFYTFRSVKGSVDVRWYGTSNGYYSEDVDFVFYTSGGENVS